MLKFNYKYVTEKKPVLYTNWATTYANVHPEK